MTMGYGCSKMEPHYEKPHVHMFKGFNHFLIFYFFFHAVYFISIF
ncbi:hypothetical protein Hanom_Chr06g00543981 [Helianthus anomalus]